MSDREFDYLKALLTTLDEWELVSVHSYLRSSHSIKTVRINDLFYVEDEEEDFEINTMELITYIDIEFQSRNLN